MLVYSSRRSDASGTRDGGEDVLYECPEGVPMLWIFAFGARNVWDPGDHVQDRGGAVGHRNLYETQVEVALARLEQAEGNLRASEAMWFWFSGMPLLRRKLLLKPRHGFVRIAAPWLVEMDEQLANRWRSATSFAENCVNYCGVGNTLAAIRSLRELDPFCPFLPNERLGDTGQLAKARLKLEERDAARRLALLTLGKPSQADPFEQGVERHVSPALETHSSLPDTAFELPDQLDGSRGPSPAEAPDGGSLVGKLTGLFKRG